MTQVKCIIFPDDLNEKLIEHMRSIFDNIIFDTFLKELNDSNNCSEAAMALYTDLFLSGLSEGFEIYTCKKSNISGSIHYWLEYFEIVAIDGSNYKDKQAIRIMNRDLYRKQINASDITIFNDLKESYLKQVS